MYHIMARSMTDTFGTSMPEDLREAIDENAVRLGYENRSDFLRGAAKRELEANGVDVDDVDE